MRVTLTLEGETPIQGTVDRYGRITGLSKYAGRKVTVIVEMLPPTSPG